MLAVHALRCRLYTCVPSCRTRGLTSTHRLLYFVESCQWCQTCTRDVALSTDGSICLGRSFSGHPCKSLCVTTMGAWPIVTWTREYFTPPPLPVSVSLSSHPFRLRLCRLPQAWPGTGVVRAPVAQGHAPGVLPGVRAAAVRANERQAGRCLFRPPSSLVFPGKRTDEVSRVVHRGGGHYVGAGAAAPGGPKVLLGCRGGWFREVGVVCRGRRR